MSQAGLDPIVLPVEGHELDTAIDLHPERAEPVCQDPLGIGLGLGHREGIGAVDGVKRHAGPGPSIQVELSLRDPDPGRNELPHDAHPLQHLEAAGVDDDRARFGRRAWQLVHHADGDVAAGELARQQKPDRSGPDDKHVGIATVHRATTPCVGLSGFRLPLTAISK